MSLLERSGGRWSVPVPVVPINFLSVPFYLLIYITIYILSSYRVSIKGYCPMKTYLEQLEQLEQLESLPENHFCFNPVTSTPEVPISSRKPQLCFISFHPRNHQKFVCGSLSSLNSSIVVSTFLFWSFQVVISVKNATKKGWKFIQK